MPPALPPDELSDPNLILSQHTQGSNTSEGAKSPCCEITKSWHVTAEATFDYFWLSIFYQWNAEAGKTFPRWQSSTKNCMLVQSQNVCPGWENRQTHKGNVVKTSLFAFMLACFRLERLSSSRSFPNPSWHQWCCERATYKQHIHTILWPALGEQMQAAAGRQTRVGKLSCESVVIVMATNHKHLKARSTCYAGQDIFLYNCRVARWWKTSPLLHPKYCGAQLSSHKY